MGSPSGVQKKYIRSLKCDSAQLPAPSEIFERRGIVLGVSRVAERPPAEHELEAVGRDRMEVPAGLELSVVVRHLDPHSVARVRGDVGDEALSARSRAR